MTVSSHHRRPQGTPIVKTARDQLDILSAYRELGSYRAAAALCGTTHKTVRRVVERRTAPPDERPPRPRSTDPFRDLIAEQGPRDRRPDQRQAPAAARAAPRATQARPATCAARSPRPRPPGGRRGGCTGPGRRCRASTWSSTGARRARSTCSAPCSPGAGSGSCGSRPTRRQATTLRLLAECFETLGGVPAVVLADRMGCLKGGVVANVVVPAPGYVAFAAHYGFRPDFCEAADPESKGVVEHLVGYAKRDLVVPAGGWDDLEAANAMPRRLVRRGQRAAPQRDRGRPGRAPARSSGRSWPRCPRCARPRHPPRCARSTGCAPSASAPPATACRASSSAGGSRSPSAAASSSSSTGAPRSRGTGSSGRAR